MKRTAIVTGAGQGIGRTIAMELAKNGFDTAILDIQKGKLEETAVLMSNAGCTTDVLPVVLDLSDPAEVDAACEKIKAHFDSVDTIVNVAGICLSTPFEEISIAEWQKVFDVNVRAGFLIVQSFIETMKQHGFGRIVSISSMAGIEGTENAACHYSASKAAIIGFVKYLSKRFAKYGITANAVAPGPVMTDMVKSLGEETLQGMYAGMPMGKLIPPEEIASIVRFLVTESDFITGTVIEARGGQFIV